MERFEAIRQYILENGEQIVEDTIFLVKHQSPTIRKDLVDKCADAIEDLVYRRLGLSPLRCTRWRPVAVTFIIRWVRVLLRR